MAARWGQAAGPPWDLNEDGIVDVEDIQQVANEWRETCHVLAETVKYYHLGDRQVAMRKVPADPPGQAGTLYYLFTDHLGSTTVAYDTSNGTWVTQRYYPYGDRRSGDVPTDRRFTGQRWDGTIGLYDYNARYYDPMLGRFVQPDPIVPNPGNPQDLNRYSYTRNNPVRYTDPTGRYIFEDEPGDYFFIPPNRSPAGQAMRLANDPCLGACTGAPLSDPQTTAIVQTAIAVLWEPADWGMTFYAWSRGDFSWWDITGLVPWFTTVGLRNADELLEAAGDITRRVPGVRHEYHHTVPREILNKYLPEEVANAPAVRGVRGAPNRWPIPEDIHQAIHQGPGGGLYNERWKQELAAITKAEGEITVGDVLRIREQLIKEFGLEVYRP